MRALLRFGEEELKHQQLFRRAEAVLQASCGHAFGRYFDQNKERVTVFCKALLALSAAAAIPAPRRVRMGQPTSLRGVRAGPVERSDPLYLDILKYHWTEENQHTKVDVLEIAKLARTMSPGELTTAFEGVQGLAGLVSETFVGQVDQEVTTFESATGRSLAEREREALREALLRSMEAIWAEVAITHPSFKQVALELSKEGAAKLGIA